jgi:hypothetical protein
MTKKKSKPKAVAKLIPPDVKQCQVFKRPSPFQLGGNLHDMVQCKNKPTWIITEKFAGMDGRKGSMSVCDDCLKEAERRKMDVTKKAI